MFKLCSRLSDSFWKSQTNKLDNTDLLNLRSLRKRAQNTSEVVNEFIDGANDRLAAIITGEYPLNVPNASDWKGRPGFWTTKICPTGLAPIVNGAQLGSELKFFHDCSLNQAIVRQKRSTLRVSVVPFELNIEVFHFTGSFISVVYDLPSKALENISKKHILSVGIDGRSNKPVSAFLRLNIKHGPNIEKIISDFDFYTLKAAEFDMAYSNVKENRIEAAWVELIINKPVMADIHITDFICSRRFRAEF